MRKFTLRLFLCLPLAATAFSADVPPTTLPSAPATQPEALCPAAAALEQQTLGIAHKCIATTVGLLIAPENGPGIETGSGVLVSADGLILTAGHMFEQPGTKFTVRFVDGRVFHGISLGMDHAADSAMARIADPAPSGGWPFSPLAPADSAKVGDWVLTTGNPGGLVIDRNPPLRLGRVTGHTARTLQTNLAIEPGDSGGPVFDLDGRVVGINSRIITGDRGDPAPKEFITLQVPISLYSSRWDDLLASVNDHPDVQLNAPRGGRNRRLRDALNQLAQKKDPEAIKILADAQANGGRFNLTPDQIQKIIDRAGNSQNASTRPATQPSGEVSQKVPQLKRLPEALQKLASQNDPQAVKLLQDQKAGTPLNLTVEQQLRLIARADLPPAVESDAGTTSGMPEAMRPQLRAQARQDLLQQFPQAKINDATLDKILDKSGYDPETQKLNLRYDLDDLQAIGVSPDAYAATGGIVTQINRRSIEAGKNSLATLSLIAPALSAAGDCVVEIRNNSRKNVSLGTIVGSDGLIATKASELPDPVSVVLPDGRTLPAEVIGKDEATDLALLKVHADGLTAVRFDDAAPLGEWLIAPTSDPDQPALGIVSDVARPIPERFKHFSGEQKIILGVGFDGPSAVIAMITPGMPAEAIGMKVGDEVMKVNDKVIANSADFSAMLKKFNTGDTLSIKVRRNGVEIEFKPTLGKRVPTTQASNGVGEADSVAGGQLSRRRTHFPEAIQTDVATWASDCGGPLINLRGETVGITIARYDRACTFALPAELVERTIAKLRGAAHTVLTGN
jgi:S1-C subfamily serine protease